MESSPALLQVGGLYTGYGRALVLQGINLSAPPASVICVIGPNGAGKTTLLHALMGVLGSTGSIRFEDQAIDSHTLEERVMLGISLVAEKRELFGSMSVQDNLLLGGYRQVRLSNRQWRSELEPVYELFPRLKERREQCASTLSGGERQMLAIGRALMAKPRLLMLDEPSLGLAPLIVEEILRTVTQLRATGVTILLVEQNARAALAISDYAYVLEMGTISLEGPASELAHDARVIDTYLGLG